MLLEFLRFSDHPAPVPGGLFIPDLRFPISLFRLRIHPCRPHECPGKYDPEFLNVALKTHRKL